jgi:hypothetical protein
MSFTKIEEYDEEFVIKLLSCLINDRDYLVQINDAIDIKYFDNPCQKWIVDVTLNYYNKYKTNPTVEYITTEHKKFKQASEKNITLAKEIFKVIKRCVNEEFDGLEYVKEEFGNFCKQCAVTNVIYDAPDLIKSSQYETLQRRLESAIKIGEPKLGGHDYNKEIEDRYREDTTKILPFNIQQLNDLFPDKQGICYGSVVINLGAGGSGKSWFGVDWGSSLLQKGYNVLYFNLESKYTFVARRFDANMTQTPLDDVKFERDKIESMLNSLEGRLHIKDCKGKEKTLSFMQNYVKKLKDEEDFVPDLVIIDYFQKMTSNEKEELTGQKNILAGIIDWAKEEDFVVYSPSPINRLGSKDKVITEDKIGGTFQAIYDTDFVMSWSRFNIMHIIKNKNGKGMGTSHEISYDPSFGKFEYVEEYFEETTNNKSLSNLHKNLVKH